MYSSTGNGADCISLASSSVCVDFIIVLFILEPRLRTNARVGLYYAPMLNKVHSQVF